MIPSHLSPHIVDKNAKHVLQLTNIAATFFIGMPINLNLIIKKNPLKIEYSLRFEAGVVRFFYPTKCTCIIFNPGVVLVVGAKRKTDAYLAAWKCCLRLRSCGVKCATVSDFTIQNVTYNANFGKLIDIVELYKNNLLVQYTPENFSSAVAIKSSDLTSSVTVNTFYTGRIIITGVEFPKDALAAYKNNLVNFKKYSYDGPCPLLKKKIKNVERNGITRDGGGGGEEEPLTTTAAEESNKKKGRRKKRKIDI